MVQPLVPDALDGQRCIFCGGPGPLTREHVIALWIAKTLDDMEPGTTEWQAHYYAGGLVERDRQHPAAKSGPTIIVRTVCASCNGGWMAQVEDRAKASLEPMIRGQATTLSPQQQLEVAAWAAKTVAALEYHEPTAVITTPDDRRLIRREMRPPSHHRIRLACRDAYMEPLITKTLVARSEGAADEAPDVFVTVLAIGFLVVHIWGGHGTWEAKTLAHTGVRTDRSLMVWPPIPGDVAWPPAISLKEEDLDEFTAEVVPWADDSPRLADWRARRNPGKQ